MRYPIFDLFQTQKNPREAGLFVEFGMSSLDSAEDLARGEDVTDVMNSLHVGPSYYSPLSVGRVHRSKVYPFFVLEQELLDHALAIDSRNHDVLARHEPMIGLADRNPTAPDSWCH